MKSSISLNPSIPYPGRNKDSNQNIVRFPTEGGVLLDSLPEGSTLEVQTENHRYRIVNRGGGQVLISGHPDFCPQPMYAYLYGSTWSGWPVKNGFIGRGMRLQFEPLHGTLITTSRIVDVQVVRLTHSRAS